MTTILDYPSFITALGGESPQLMVYGFAECKYFDIATTLLEPAAFGAGVVENPIKRVFMYTIANIYLREIPEITFTLEGRKIHKIRRSDKTPSICKAALVNIIIENVKRQRDGLPLIPVLFTIDISTNTSGFYPPSVSDMIINKKQYTLKELRRVYKLCTDTTLPSEVRDVAERTFKFVKVLVSSSPPDVVGTSTFAFESIKAPWQQEPRETWDRALAEHRDRKKAIPPSGLKLRRLAEKEANGWHWRPQLLEAIGAPPVLGESST